MGQSTQKQMEIRTLDTHHMYACKFAQKKNKNITQAEVWSSRKK